MTTSVASQIDRVRLYNRGATVYRVLRVEATADEGLPRQIAIPGLPLGLYDASVRLRVVGTPEGMKGVAADLQIGLWAPPPSPKEVDSQRERLRALEREITELRAQQQHLVHEQKLFAAVEIPVRPAPTAEEPKPPPSPMTARMALERFLDGALTDRYAQWDKVTRQMRDRLRSAAQLRDTIARASTSDQVQAEQVTKMVLATLQVTGDSSTPQDAVIDLELEYFVPGARWTASYQCDIDEDGNEATLTMRALVCQYTHEDWSKARLLLSTARPSQWVGLPKLKAIKIGKAQAPPVRPRGFRVPPRGSHLLYQDHDRERKAIVAHLPERPSWIGGPPLKAQNKPVLLPKPSAATPSAEPATVPASSLAASTDVPRPKRSPHTRMAMAPQLIQETLEGLNETSAFASFDRMEEKIARVEAAYEAEAASDMFEGDQGALDDEADDEAWDAEEALHNLKRDMSKTKRRKDKKLGAKKARPQQPAVPQFGRLRLSDTGASRGELIELDEERYFQRWAQSDRWSAEEREAALDMVSEHRRAVRTVFEQLLPSGSYDVRQSAGRFDYLYPTEDRVDVPSDGRFHSVPVSRREARCRLEYVVVPREKTDVFRVAFIENPTEAPLLPGSVEVYLGGHYVLTTAMPAVAPRGRLRLGLGVEQGIKCARNTSFREERSTEAVVATADLHHQIDVELVNNLSRPITCEVRERIPQARPGAEVVVRETQVEPPWEAWEQAELGSPLKGGRRWQVSLEPGEAAALMARYMVQIYANNTLEGGNRREN